MKQSRLLLMLLGLFFSFISLCAQTVWDGTVADSFAGGSGTEDDPYLISDGSELAYMGKVLRENGSQYKGAHFKLVSNIILNEDVLTDDLRLNEKNVDEFNKWLPIGQYNNTSDPMTGLNGYFDGNNCCISGIYCPDNYYNAGLFAYVRTGEVHNLAILDSYVKGSMYVGGLTGSHCAYNSGEKGEIYNCYVEACVEGGSYTGIAIGHLGGGYSSISNCYIYGRVSGSCTGSIAGYTDRGHSENCYSVCLSGNNGTGRVFTGSASNLYHDATVNSSANYSTGKTTKEMQSEEFAQLLGEPFVFAEGSYPYIDGLPVIGEKVAFSSTAFRLNRGALVNGRGSSLKYYREFDGTNVSTLIYRADAGETVYVKLSLRRHMILEDGSLKVTSDDNEASIVLTPVAENIWSFTMPESSVTVSAALYRNPNAQLLWSGEIAEDFTGGTGTKDDPYLISCGEELAYLAKITNENPNQTKGVYYKLVSDIVLNDNVLNEDYELIGTPENEWTPIGTGSNIRFQGVFDGDFHIISGMYINTTGYVGLFGYAYGAVIKNLALVDSYAKAGFVGALVNSIGGGSLITHCYVEAMADGGTYASTLLAGMDENSASTVEYCYTTGRTNNECMRPAGLVSYQNSGNYVRNCYTTTRTTQAINDGSGKPEANVQHVYACSDYGPTFSYHGKFCSKTAAEMKTEKFAKLLGKEFEFESDNFPYIPCLLKVGEKGSSLTEHFISIGELTNGKGCSAMFYSVYEDNKLNKAVRRVNVGEKVYMKVILGRRLLLTEGTLLVINDQTREVVELTKEAENIWSFIMPESAVTVSATFHRNPDLPVLWNGDIAEAFAEGEGTEDDPYLIHDGDELAYLAQLCNANGALTKGKYYKLVNDIYLNEDVLTDDFELNETPANEWTPIGKTNDHAFQGVFDGDDHYITGLYISSKYSNAGFFGYTNNAIIRNLSLVDTYVGGQSSSALVYSIAATDTAVVSRCYVEALVTCSGRYHSYGVAGVMTAKCNIENCYASGRLSASYPTSFPYSVPQGATIRNCFSAMKGGSATDSNSEGISNVYSDQDLGSTFSYRDDFCSKHTIEMYTTDFATRMGEPFEYVLGNYPYIPGLQKIGENRDWTAPEDPTHGGAGDVWDGERSIIFASGTGSKDDPYIINNGAQLAYLAKLTNANGSLTKGRYYKLAADISLNADSVLTSGFELNGTPENIWEPIGKDSKQTFQGVFNGNNHTISGIYIPSGDYPAFIGYANDATICNLSLIDTYVAGSYSSALVNTITASDTTMISRCYVEAFVNSSGRYYHSAGLTHSQGSKCGIEYCYTSGRLEAGYKAGLVYTMTGGSVRNCYSAMKGATAIYSPSSDVVNVYSDEDLGGTFTTREDFCSKHTIEMHTTDFATRMGEPFEYVLGNYPYIPGLKKIGENRGWMAPTDPTHGGAGGSWDGERSIIFASGTGSKDDPYIINNGAQLAYLAKLTNANGSLTKGRYYKLAADISLNADSVLTSEFELKGTPGNIWEPIGKDSNHTFQGVFDGNNHTISGIYIPSGDYPAFIGYANDATICNLSLIDTYVAGSYSSALVNTITASDTTMISRCYVEAFVNSSGRYYHSAGLTHSQGSKCGIEYCYTSGRLEAGYKAGLVYLMSGGSVRNSFSAMKGATAIYSPSSDVVNVYSDEDLGGYFSTKDDFCSKHTIEMYTTDFATRMGEPFEYELGNYPYIPSLKKIGENRGWTTPEDPTHGGAGDVWDGERSIIFASGTGSKDDPYIINNGAQLAYLAKLTNANGSLTKGRYYRLEADIKLNEQQVLTGDYELNGTPENIWEPIGKDSKQTFQGVFDGNNYTISGIYIPSGDYPAFIGYANDATICNLSLIDTYVAGSYSSALVNTITASDTTIISRCYVEAFVNSSGRYYHSAGLTHSQGSKCGIEYCYTSGRLEAGYKAGLVYVMSGGGVRNCYSTMQGGPAIYSPSDSVINVYFDSNRAGTTSNVRDDFRSAETPEMLSTDFAARMGAPFEYAVGYYPYIYGLHKIDENGKTSIVNGYSLQLGTLENGNDCTVEFYRGYKKKTKELSMPVVPGSKVFVDNATTIYVKVNASSVKRLTDEGLIVTANTSGNKIDVTEVDYDLYSFQITNDAVTIAGAFLDGNFCGDPEVNNGRNVRWQLNNSKGKLTIEGAGNMVVGAWKSFANSVKTIEMAEGVTNVAAQAFKGMNKITTVTLPVTLETIGTEAFSGCAATVDLRPCTLLTALHANEFAQFTGTLYLPATVTTIEADAFAGTYAKVQHVYSPVADGETLFANDVQVPDVDGMGDIARYGITDNQEVRLVWGSGYLVTPIANTDGNLKVYADEALSKEILEGYKAIRTGDQTRIYVKVEPKNTKILFLNDLKVKAGSTTLTVTQEGDEVFSFLMPKAAVTISAQFATGGYCGNTAVNNGHNLIWTLEDGELAFQKNSFAQGTDDAMGSNAPWSSLGSNVKSVDLSNVTNIGSNAFTSCTNLVGLELPATPVVTVGDNAFASQMVLIIPAESWDSYQDAGWAAYAEQTAKDKETVTLKDGLQWRTYYSKVGRLLPEGLKAYTVTNIGYAEVVTSEPLNYIPAGQAVLIENSAKTASTAEAVTSLETCLLTTDESNLLQWIAEPTAVSAGQGYTLYKDEFVKVSSGTLPVGIAFLPAQGSSASRLGIFISETTGIDGTESTSSESGDLYNLKGQRVDKPTVKGLYLRNGKKVVIK